MEKPTKWGLKRWITVDNYVESVDLSTLFCIEYTQAPMGLCNKSARAVDNILQKFAFAACLETFRYVILNYA